MTTLQAYVAQRPVAAVVLTAASSAWLLSGPVLGHMGPPWPCIIAGLVLLLCTTMLAIKPVKTKAWGTLAALTGALTLLLGAGAIVPAFLGVAGGVWATVWTPAGASA